jgi:isopentenyl-diphosphate Delta-isomerase
VSDVEQVVLLDERAGPVGTAPKSTVHGADTPLHLAFSCHVLDDDGRVLITRRALSKQTWPGVWTNTFCGHPGPGEDLEAAVHRRARVELGLALDDVTLTLPDFRYRAVDASGVVENEVCPVFVAHATGPLHPDPDEVAEWAWVEPSDVAAAVSAAPWAFSPWLGLQVPRLALYDTAARAAP